jgi:ComF family protein
MVPHNPVLSAFGGRVRVEHATAYFYFNKGSKVQRLVHQLKYKGRKDIGLFLGTQYGLQLISSPFYNSINLILPVPLHKKREQKRGYNQSDLFAIGLAGSMNIPHSSTILLRKTATETQTHRSRFNRFRNVREIFTVTDPQCLCGQHVLLVDDVITTGATLESCISILSSIPGIRISVACIASTVL